MKSAFDKIAAGLKEAITWKESLEPKRLSLENAKIVDIDYLENDAILEYDGRRIYFQFTVEPSLEEALVFIITEYHNLLEEKK